MGSPGCMQDREKLRGAVFGAGQYVARQWEQDEMMVCLADLGRSGEGSGVRVQGQQLWELVCVEEKPQNIEHF